ncbi:anti-sigma factor, partial [Streptomyces nanshensis]
LSRFALAACLALAAAAGGVAAWQYRAAQDAREQAAQSRARQEELVRVLAASDARTTGRGELPGGASGTVVVSRERDRAAFLASGMDAPPGGKVYQLWFADGKKMRPAGLVDSHGDSTAQLMEGKVGRASAMGVTVEPAGGSPQPTTEPLALMKLPGTAG